MKATFSQLAFLVLVVVAVEVAAAPVHSSEPLRDKTLVVWAAPADLAQKGGSALTIDDVESHFDGIVFGELTPRKWMPGSDGFRRTLQQQSSWPEETADPKTHLEIAVTYQARRVTVYRNGQLSAQYTMEVPPQVVRAAKCGGDWHAAS